jgi:hypothetical protein
LQGLILQQNLFQQPILMQFSRYQIGFKFSEAYAAREFGAWHVTGT